MPQENEPGQSPTDAASAPVLPAARDDDGTDVPPPFSISGKGPIDQSVPDVATGSTPLTRVDD